MKAEFARALGLAELVTEVGAAIAGADDASLDQVIDGALARIGAYVDADRAYLMLFDDEQTTSRNTHEWCGPGIEPQMDNLQDVPLALLPWFMAQIRQGPLVADIPSLPEEARAERELLEPQGIISIIIVPMQVSSRIVGFVGFDAVRGKRQWTCSDASLLTTMSHGFAALLERRRAMVRLEDQRAELQAVLRAIPDLVFSVDRLGVVRYQKVGVAADLAVPPELGDGLTLHELLPAAIATVVLDGVHRALETAAVVTVRYELTLDRGQQDFEVRLFVRDATSVVAIVRNITEELRAHRDLETHRTRLQQLAQRLTREEADLRKRIAGEVHDGIAQELAMTKMLLRKAMSEPEAVVDVLGMAVTVIDGAIDRIDHLTEELAPPSLRTLGLASALREVCTRLRQLHGVDFTVEVGARPQLSYELESMLYWSARELIFNAVKHAACTRIEVHISDNEDRHEIVVEDDGRGMADVDEHFGRGFGLFNTRERMRLAGGDLIVTATERGTRGHIELPHRRPSC